MNEVLKPIRWIRSSYQDLKSMPVAVRKSIGFALDQAQRGGKHVDAKPLKGFGGAGVLEIVEDHSGDTFRGVYTVRYAELALIKSRLKDAELDYQQWKGRNQKKIKQ